MTSSTDTVPERAGYPYEPPAPDLRATFVHGLRDLADFLDLNPAAPLPSGPFVKHFNDADDFDAAVPTIGEKVTTTGGGYEHCDRRFGPLTYGVQTNGRAEQRLRRREVAIAAREAELGHAS